MKKIVACLLSALLLLAVAATGQERQAKAGGIVQVGSFSVVVKSLDAGDTVLWRDGSHRWSQWNGRGWVSGKGQLMVRGALFEVVPAGWHHPSCGCLEFCAERDK